MSTQTAPLRVYPRGQLDLARSRGLGRFLRWRHARTAVQLPLLLISILIIFDGLAGPSLAPKNLAGVLPWVHWRGLVVLGFPSNDFNQELATNKEIAEFCKLTYFVEFPMIEKGSVTGPGANAFFKQLAVATGASPQWNFHKYLIAPDGKTVHSFGTRVEPDSREIMGKLVPMLK